MAMDKMTNRLSIIAALFAVTITFAVPLPAMADTDLEDAKEEMHEGDYESAAKHFEKALEESPDNPEALVGLADAQLGMGASDQAYATAKRAILRHPDYAPAYLILGRVHERRGELDRARHFYRQFVQHSKGSMPTDPGLLIKLRKLGVY